MAKLSRYARQLALPGLGKAGQERLGQARVALIGLGGLGSPAAMSLAAAGVGTLRLIDDDRVEESNLHRQFLHGQGSLGQSKLQSAAWRLQDLNPEVALELHETRFRPENAQHLIENCDLVLDGADNFVSRYLANDACVLAHIPLIQGSVLQWEGSLRVIDPAKGGPCLRCHLPEPPAEGIVPNCAEGGVLGVLPNLIGSAMALEALKLLLKQGQALSHHLLHFDALKHQWRKWTLEADPACPLCGKTPRIADIQPENYPSLCAPALNSTFQTTQPMSSNSNRQPLEALEEVSVHELKQALDSANPAAVFLDVREDSELEIAALPGFLHIPMGEVPERLGELDASQEIWVFCRSGGRSARVVEFLSAQGYPARNITGGILAWSAEIDPQVPAY